MRKKQSKPKTFATQFGKYMAGGNLYFWSGYAVFALCYSVAHWSFAGDRKPLREMQHVGRYVTIESIGFVLDYLIIFALNAIGITPYIGFFISAGFFTVWSYVWYKYYVFPQKAASKAEPVR
jgi:putative flippase GtrA